jgi:hypothetical protein
VGSKIVTFFEWMILSRPRRMRDGVRRGVGGKYGNRPNGYVGELGNLIQHLYYLDSSMS